MNPGDEMLIVESSRRQGKQHTDVTAEVGVIW
jgi:hypothetical protein